MLQPDNTDDEDDYEGYFLQPSSNYNIAEKIIEANKELFSHPIPSSPLPEDRRRVKFREILEDFGPENSEDGYGELGEDISISDYTDIQNNSVNIVLECEDKISVEADEQPIEKEMMTEEIIEDICEEIEELDVVTENSSNVDDDNENVSVDGSSSDEMLEEVENVEIPSAVKEIDINLMVLEDSSVSTIEIFDMHTKIKKPSSAKSTGKMIKSQNSKCDDNEHNSNLRSCCKNKHLEVEKLPKYNGFKSQYGLSKEQLEKREKKLEQMKRREMKKKMDHIEKHRSKMQMNEEIFATWLNKKMKNPVNKTKNMYDFKGYNQNRTKNEQNDL